MEKGNIIDDEELELVKDEISTVTTKIHSIEEKISDLVTEHNNILELKRNKMNSVKCDHCDNTFTNFHELKNHLKEVNVNEMFNCQQCDKQFYSK